MTVYGIDLGATDSFIAYVDGTGRPVVLKSALGEDTTPSVVYFESPENVVVGREAKDSAVLVPDLVVQLVKRQMGNQDWRFVVYGQEYTPEVVSALILRELARAAQEQTGEVVQDVVITVPANFGLLEREATHKAGQIAGLNVLNILPEPVAAVLAYEATGQSPRKRHILVYDLGGGSFDTTVIRVDGDSIQVICTDGSDHLGGVDWDAKISDFLLQSFTDQFPQLDPSGDEQFMQDLATLAEQLKKALSTVRARRFSLRFDGSVARLELTRERLEDLTSELLERTMEITERTIATARTTGVDRFDDVLLVGGMTLMPAIARTLRDRFGLEGRRHEPQLAVAKGAALFALVQKVKVGPASDSPSAPERGAVQQVADQLGISVEQVEALAAKQVTAVDHIVSAEPSPAEVTESPLSRSGRVVDDDARFTVYRPQALTPGLWASLLVFAHKTDLVVDPDGVSFDPTEQVEARARAYFGAETVRPVGEDARQGLTRGSRLRIVPDLPGIRVNPEDAEVDWWEPLHEVVFRLLAEPALAGTVIRGAVRIWCGALVVGEVSIAMPVAAGSPAAESPPTAESVQRYRKIFVSYSHLDGAVVQNFAEYAQALGDQYLQDMLVLRSGERWNDRLLQLIEDADVFQLFWSHNSMRSQHCRDEWEHALALGRPFFVRPLYWEEPLPADPGKELPPAGLRALHFVKVPVIKPSPPDTAAAPGPLEVSFAMLSARIAAPSLNMEEQLAIIDVLEEALRSSSKSFHLQAVAEMLNEMAKRPDLFAIADRKIEHLQAELLNLRGKTAQRHAQARELPKSSRPPSPPAASMRGSGTQPGPSQQATPGTAIKTRRGMAITSTILTVPLVILAPIGIAALIYSNKVTSRLAVGDIAGARKASSRVALAFWISIATWIIIIVISAHGR